MYTDAHSLRILRFRLIFLLQFPFDLKKKQNTTNKETLDLNGSRSLYLFMYLLQF